MTGVACLEAGEIRSITLDASDAESASTFSMTVDTTATRREERIVVGDEAGGDGLTMATAYSVAQFATADCGNLPPRQLPTKPSV